AAAGQVEVAGGDHLTVGAQRVGAVLLTGGDHVLVQLNAGVGDGVEAAGDHVAGLVSPHLQVRGDVPAGGLLGDPGHHDLHAVRLPVVQHAREGGEVIGEGGDVEGVRGRSEEHTSELQSRENLV